VLRDKQENSYRNEEGEKGTELLLEYHLGMRKGKRGQSYFLNLYGILGRRKGDSEIFEAVWSWMYSGKKYLRHTVFVDSPLLSWGTRAMPSPLALISHIPRIIFQRRRSGLEAESRCVRRALAGIAP
jgi:hypothetical protein